MKRQRIITGVLVMGALLTLTSFHLGPMPAAYAASITVNTTNDELNSDDDCSLREAILAANTNGRVSGCAAGSGADTITLPAGIYTLTILGAGENANATGDLDITGHLTINGGEGGITVIQAGTNPANGIDRVLDVHSGVTVEMNHLWIEYGRTPAIAGEEHGGGIRNSGTLILSNSYVSSNTADGYGGGIYNLDALTLNNSTIGHNAAEYGGGGICNPSFGTLTLNNSTVSGNTTYWCGGGIYNSGMLTLDNSAVGINTAHYYGGGIWNPGTLTMNNGTVYDNVAEGGGGIYNGGTLTGDNCTVSGNGAARYGGGINNGGTLTLENSAVADNHADSDHDLIGDGGGIWNDGPLEVYNSTVADNTATNGGGIYNYGDSTVILSRSTVSDNGCAYSGGGIYSVDPSGTMTLHMSTVKGNYAGVLDGGGIYHGGGELTLNTCTISGNTSGRSGGGIYSAAGAMALRNATIANNGADIGAGGSGDGGGIYVSGSTAHAQNTIIGTNADWYPKTPDCWGTLISQGYNMLEDTTGCTFAPTTGDITGLDPNLSALADNGGPTWTHSLLGGSPAIDWIPNGISGCQAGVSVDQRGYLRAGGAGYGGSLCDIGAYEYDSAPRVAQFSGGTYSVNEGAGTATITVNLNPACGGTVTVDYAASDGTARLGSDYTAQSDTLTFDPGITSRTFALSILEDGLDEADETVTLTLSDPTNATISGTNPVTLTIEDNDPLPTVRFSGASYSVNEGAGSATITVNLTPASGRLVEVDCATSDGTATASSDYTATSERVYFYPGDTSRILTALITDDALDEPDETIILTLSDAANATIEGTNPAILTIADNDGVGFFIYLPLVVRDQ